MKLSQFKFDLPLNLIAQHPAKRREDSRMMVVHRKTGQIENKHFRDIMEYFDDKDVFVVNNTKVFPARMYGRKEKTGAKIEVFLLRELNKPNRLWDVIVDPARNAVVPGPADGRQRRFAAGRAGLAAADGEASARVSPASALGRDAPQSTR